MTPSLAGGFLTTEPPGHSYPSVPAHFCLFRENCSEWISGSKGNVTVLLHFFKLPTRKAGPLYTLPQNCLKGPVTAITVLSILIALFEYM